MLPVETEHFNSMLSSLCVVYMSTYHRWTTSIWSCRKAAISLQASDFTARLTQKSSTEVRTSSECSVLQLSCLKITYLHSSTIAKHILKKPPRAGNPQNSYKDVSEASMSALGAAVSFSKSLRSKESMAPICTRP